MIDALPLLPALANPDAVVYAFETGAIAAVGNPSDLSVFQEAYLPETGITDPILPLMAEFRDALAAADREKMQSAGHQIANVLAGQKQKLDRILQGIEAGNQRRHPKPDWENSVNQLRLAIGARFGAIYVGGKNDSFPPFPGLYDAYHTSYFVDPLAHFVPENWMHMLQASFYAALDKSFANQKGIAEGRDCLDREIGWGMAVKIYSQGKESKIDPNDLTSIHFHRYHSASLHLWRERIPDRGILRATFQEINLDAIFSGEIFEITPTPQEIRLAKRRARRHLEKHGLHPLRIGWLKARGPHLLRAKKTYFEKLTRSFGFAGDFSFTQNVAANPDLFLLYQFLKEILWERFLKSLQKILSLPR